MEVQTNLLIDACNKCIVDLKGKLDEVVKQYNAVNNGNFFTRLFRIHKPLRIVEYSDLYLTSCALEKGVLQENIRQLTLRLYDTENILEWAKVIQENNGYIETLQLEDTDDFLIPYIEKEFQVVY